MTSFLSAIFSAGVFFVLFALAESIGAILKFLNCKLVGKQTSARIISLSGYNAHRDEKKGIITSTTYTYTVSVEYGDETGTAELKEIVPNEENSKYKPGRSVDVYVFVENYVDTEHNHRRKYRVESVDAVHTAMKRWPLILLISIAFLVVDAVIIFLLASAMSST